jgi:hypothetical protein
MARSVEARVNLNPAIAITIKTTMEARRLTTSPDLILDIDDRVRRQVETTSGMISNSNNSAAGFVNSTDINQYLIQILRT